MKSLKCNWCKFTVIPDLDAACPCCGSPVCRPIEPEPISGMSICTGVNHRERTMVFEFINPPARTGEQEAL